ncbi:MAG: fructosamine kinase family protein [Flavobacteriales bacterium]|nr:fructosamine kinase family protein [Flavobacteriales bacterium]MCB9193502.1 fructosamine kinase family protein [Flavobacteriales bacterium]
MPLSGSLIEQLSERLSHHLGAAVDIEQADPVGGGSINDAWRLATNAGPFFLKTNSADRFPSLFEAEADGLQRLQAADALRVPTVIAFGEDHDDTFLLLEHIEQDLRTEAFWERFGTGLAALHRHTWGHFGLERDNHIGSLEQVNTPLDSWAEFFIHRRLEPMLKMARDHRRVEAGMAFRFERLFHKLDGLFPHEPPALLHGDLWSGNFLCAADGAPVLIDPAVYYGHREMDIAMSRLFGGFEAGFYTAYNAAWPLEQGWQDRLDLCNLYPLLVHVNLFGGGYVAQVEGVLRKFV